MRLSFVNFCHKIADWTLKSSNLPERYVKRTMDRVEWKTPDFPNYSRKVIKKKKFHYDIHKPWTAEFRELNEKWRQRKVFLEPIKEWHIFLGDRVEILVGKDKGKQGIVVEVIQERNWVVVEGLNTYLRTIGKTKNFPGMLIQQEAPLLITSEVALVDPSDMLPTKIEWRFTEDGEKVRVCERSKRIIPMPKNSEETYDYKTVDTYLEKDKDTSAAEASKITFEPSLETFEMSVMREMGIKEDREAAPVFWY